MVALKCRNLNCSFGGVRALDDVSLELQQSDFIAVLGDNAAGKTTLLNAISGLVSLQSGEILLNGHNLTGRSDRQRALAGVIRSFEDSGICARLTSVDNVAMALHQGRLTDRRRRAAVALATVRLEAECDKVAGALSMGQKRRLELARVLARAEELKEKCLVLLDEPFRGLDEQSRLDLVQLLRKNCIGRFPMIMVEHERQVVRLLDAQPVWMERGRLVDRKAISPIATVQSSKGLPDSDAPPELSVKDIHAGYGPVEVLHGVSLVVRRGEVVRLIGGNGAGKSTLLRVIMGTLPPSRGHVEIFQQQHNGPVVRPLAGVGYAPQGCHLVPQLTVGAHLELARNVAQRAGRLPNFGPAFVDAFAELAAVLNRRVGDLSSGLRGLTAVATALTLEPRLLIADEPASGLSPTLGDRLYSFLKNDWVAQGGTTLIVEHEPRDFPARNMHLARGQLI